MDRYRSAAADIVMDLHCVFGICVNRRLEPPRGVGINRNGGQADPRKALADLSEESGVVRRIACEEEMARGPLYYEAGVQPTFSAKRSSCRPVPCRNGMIPVPPVLVGLPPLKLDEAMEAVFAEPGAETLRENEKSIVTFGDPSDTWKIQVVVMIVTDKDHINRRQFVEGDSRYLASAHPEEARRSAAIGPHGVREDGDPIPEQENCGLANPGNVHGFIGLIPDSCIQGTWRL